MLLDFNQIYQKYNASCNIRGIVHVGACTGEERDTYQAHSINNVIWFEANPETYNALCKHIRNTNHIAYNALLANTDDEEVEFYVTSNYYGASSSMLKLEKHLIHHPKVKVVKTIKLQTNRFDTFMSHNSNIKLSNFNFLNIDVQGAELLVLKGMGNLLHNFDYVYSEINTDKLYENCCLLKELETYLNQYNFRIAEISMTPYDWGDALFVKTAILQDWLNT
jgi:FkbM family methyltransferase